MNMILFEKLPKDLRINSSDERAKHIVSVLKLKVGDNFKMGIVNQSEGLATITELDENGLSFTYSPTAKPSMFPVTLLVAQVRPICMKRILREAVSLGVEKLILTGSETGEKSYLKSTLYTSGEYMEYLMDGAMQSCHAGFPEIVFSNDVKQAIAAVQTPVETALKTPVETTQRDLSLLMLDNVTGAENLSCASIKQRAVLAVGPERGWTDRERKLFIEAGYKPMLLGSRVLRTETACSAGVAVLLSRMGLL